MKDNPKYMFQIGAKLDSMIYEQNMSIFGADGRLFVT